MSPTKVKSHEPGIPFANITCLGCTTRITTVTVWFEHDLIGARGAAFALGPAGRLLVAGRAACFYAGRLVWPHPLVFIYPRWVINPADPAQWLYPAAVLAGVGLLVARRRRHPGTLAAVLCFLGTLLPALGFVNVYPFVFSWVADHFQYAACAALLALAGAAFAAAWGRMEGREGAAGSGTGGRVGVGPGGTTAAGDCPGAHRAGRAAQGALAAGAVGVLAALGAATHAQAGLYATQEGLYEATLARNPEAWLAHVNLGALLDGRGRPGEAIDHYREAIRLNPGYAEAHNNLGNALVETGRAGEAEGCYARALALRPGFAEAELNWGNALAAREAYAAAQDHYRRALVLRPGYAQAAFRLGTAQANAGDLGAAVDSFRRALAMRPGYAEAEANWGLALVVGGGATDALAHLERAVALDPALPEARAYLGLAYVRLGQPGRAIDAYRGALRLNPGDAAVHLALADALRADGRGDEAREEEREGARLQAAGR